MAIFKKKEFVLLRKLLAVLLLGTVVFLSVAYAIVSENTPLDDTYQSVIQRKYEKLENAEGPKIVIVGGSNAGFGIDSELIEKETGYTVVNMGLHAGFGQLFNTEIALGHIGQGDILLLAYEYGLTSAEFEKLGDLNYIMVGIGTKLEMYKEIPLKNMPALFGNLFSFAKFKATKNTTESGTYCSASFDALGNMTLKRAGFVIPDYDNKKQLYGQIYGTSLLPPNDDFPYLNDLREFVEGRGASVYFVAPALLADAYNGTEQQLLDFAAELERRTGIPYISNPFDYCFPREYMFDTIYHCNDMGQLKRTELLINDLRTHGVLN